LVTIPIHRLSSDILIGLQKSILKRPNQTMKRIAVIVEQAADGGYGVYAPDLPGCVGMGETKEEAMQNMIEAIQLHFEGMKAEGITIPESRSEAENLVLAI
jgi:predicted RNase H-like HicB family nuclease